MKIACKRDLSPPSYDKIYDGWGGALFERKRTLIFWCFGAFPSSDSSDDDDDDDDDMDDGVGCWREKNTSLKPHF